MRLARLLALGAIGVGAVWFAAKRRSSVPVEPPTIEAPAPTQASAPPPAATVPPAPALPDVSSLPPVRLLFVGNSLVFSQDMPGMLVELARGGRVNLQVTQHTQGGATLAQHEQTPALRALLDAGGWHVVVLQEQSQRPALGDDWVRDNVDAPATSLARRAKASSPTARVVFYVTPARQNGDPTNVNVVPALATYGGMQDRITNTYRRIATAMNADLALAGEAWRKVRYDRPDLELYADPVHPNRDGAYLIACVFYATLLDKNPVGSPFTAGIDSATATYLQRVAWETVQTSLSASYRP